MNDATLTIGQVARLAGVTASAIRYYESIGVLPEPDRIHGRRRYTQETVRRLQVIDIAKRAGFSLDDARVLLESENGGLLAHEQLRDLARRKLPEVDALIQRAQQMWVWLSTASRYGCETLDPSALVDSDAATRQRALRDHAAPELSIAPVERDRSPERLDDRGLENLVVTQRNQLRSVILSAAERSIERQPAAPLADMRGDDLAG